MHTILRGTSSSYHHHHRLHIQNLEYVCSNRWCSNPNCGVMGLDYCHRTPSNRSHNHNLNHIQTIILCSTSQPHRFKAPHSRTRTWTATRRENVQRFQPSSFMRSVRRYWQFLGERLVVVSNCSLMSTSSWVYQDMEHKFTKTTSYYNINSSICSSRFPVFRHRSNHFCHGHALIGTYFSLGDP